MKRFTALFLVFSILTLSGTLYAKKKGADLIIQRTDGQRVRGELIAVKQKSLLLMGRDSDADLNVDIVDIEVIFVAKNPRLKGMEGAGLGLLIGGGVGVLVGFVSGDDPPGWFSMTAGTKAVLLGIVFGVIGAVIGGTFGIPSLPGKTIQIEGKSDSEIKEILKKLSKKARIRDFQ